MNFYQKVYEVTKRIPEGKVASYGQIAFAAGNPRAARVVGNALHHNPEPDKIPCHRVVNKGGRLAPGFAFGGPDAQRHMLENEGVRVDDKGYVDMAVYQHRNL